MAKQRVWLVFQSWAHTPVTIRFDSGARFHFHEVVMLLKADGKPREVWGVMVGQRHEINPSYLCSDAHQAEQLAAQHKLQFGEDAWPVSLWVYIARTD